MYTGIHKSELILGMLYQTNIFRGQLCKSSKSPNARAFSGDFKFFAILSLELIKFL